MIRGLVVVAVGGALLSGICLSASGATHSSRWSIPGADWGFNINDSDKDSDDDQGAGSIHLKGNEPAISRDLAYAGSQSLSIDVPAAVTFTQGPVPKITATGPSEVLSHLVLDGTDLKLDRSLHGVFRRHTLTIAITAPVLHDFTLSSAQTLDIASIQTDALRIVIEGAGKVTAKGTARSVDLQIDGAGDANLANLAVGDAKLAIDGFGHIVAGPTGHASARIDGAGSISLTRRPASLDQQIDGAGSIHQPPATPGAAPNTSTGGSSGTSL